MIAAEFELHPDELLYSGWARYGDRLRCGSQAALNQHLFGVHRLSVLPDLPSRIDAFVARLPPGHELTATSLIRDHPTLPYYSLFNPPARLAASEKSMRGAGHPFTAASLGTGYSKVERLAGLRFCPCCAADDIASLGCAYWRRFHQLPGVVVCAEHAVPLVYTNAGRSEPAFNRKAFLVPLGPALIAGAGNEAADPVRLPALLAVAEMSRSLLAAWVEEPALEQFAMLYRMHLRETGFGHRQVFASIRRAVAARYGADYLDRVGCTLAAESHSYACDWLNVICSPRDIARAQPLHHLLLLGTLGLSVESLKRPPHLPSQGAPVRTRRKNLVPNPEWDTRLRRLVGDPQLSRTKIAAALGVQPRVMTYHAFRLGVMRDAWTVPDPFRVRLQAENDAERRNVERLHAYRLECERLIEAHPNAGRSELYGLNDRMYHWLRTYDSIWLQARLPQQRPNGRREQDWTVRDAEMLRLATSVVAKIRAAPEPVRVTQAAIFAGMGVPGSIVKRRVGMPLTAQYVAAAAETGSTFTRRRLEWALPLLEAESGEVTIYGLMQRAGMTVRSHGVGYNLAKQLVHTQQNA